MEWIYTNSTFKERWLTKDGTRQNGELNVPSYHDKCYLVQGKRVFFRKHDVR